jgi:hypothetical protein
VGIDNNERLLQLARARYPSAEFHEGDMRNLDCASEFEAVINWFTSFGYFNPATNDRLLTSLARAYAPAASYFSMSSIRCVSVALWSWPVG